LKPPFSCASHSSISSGCVWIYLGWGEVSIIVAVSWLAFGVRLVSVCLTFGLLSVYVCLTGDVRLYDSLLTFG